MATGKYSLGGGRWQCCEVEAFSPPPIYVRVKRTRGMLSVADASFSNKFLGLD